MNDLLRPDIEDQIRRIERADIVIGIPSYNNSRTIWHVIRAVMAGFAKYFSQYQTLLINSDGGSSDGTQEIAYQATITDYRTLLITHRLYPIHRIITPYHGIAGKGSAIRTIMQIAATLEAKVCAVVDADLRSITPEWIELLVSPVLKEGFDFVAPLYHRHKYDGTITNSIVYPMTRALYGKRIRQPIGGDFGFSGRLARHFLAQDVWHTDIARFGIDIWMTTTAVTGGFLVCQSFLGAKIHDAKDPGADLSAMLNQVVGSVFTLMENHQGKWTGVQGSTPVPLFGFEYEVGLEPIRVDIDRMIGNFRVGVRELVSIWEKILEEQTWREIQALDRYVNEEFRYPPGLWVRTVFDFALAFHQNRLNRDHILQALTPLYLARTASFVLETANARAEDVENILEGLCLEYEEMKPDLARRWDSHGGKGK